MTLPLATGHLWKPPIEEVNPLLQVIVSVLNFLLDFLQNASKLQKISKYNRELSIFSLIWE